MINGGGGATYVLCRCPIKTHGKRAVLDVGTLWVGNAASFGELFLVGYSRSYSLSRMTVFPAIWCFFFSLHRCFNRRGLGD